MTDAADLFPAVSALAALGGASEDWQQGYRWGWEDAAKKSVRKRNPPPPPSWKERGAERKKQQELRNMRRNGRVVVRNYETRIFFPDTQEGYDAGYAAYERENR